MNTFGEQIIFTIDPGKASRETLTKIFTCLDDVHKAAGGAGLLFRIANEPSVKWKVGIPPDDGVFRKWVVKTNDPWIPEEVVIPDGLGSGFIPLPGFHQPTRASTSLVENITHHRPLTPEEENWLLPHL